jgi:hypothetical protein
MVSLCQAFRTPDVKFRQSLSTTSQFTIGRCSTVVCPEAFVDGDIDASERYAKPMVKTIPTTIPRTKRITRLSD